VFEVVEVVVRRELVVVVVDVGGIFGFFANGNGLRGSCV